MQLLVEIMKNVWCSTGKIYEKLKISCSLCVNFLHSGFET